MILDKIENSNLYRDIHLGINKAFEFILNSNFTEMSTGNYDIEGDDIFAIIKDYETKNSDDLSLEAHLKYLDVHYIAAGVEKIGIANFANQKPTKAYDSVNDYMLYNESCDWITLNQGMFAIFFPDDLHMPEIKSANFSDVRKVVVKVKI